MKPYNVLKQLGTLNSNFKFNTRKIKNYKINREK